MNTNLKLTADRWLTWLRVFLVEGPMPEKLESPGLRGLWVAWRPAALAVEIVPRCGDADSDGARLLSLRERMRCLHFRYDDLESWIRDCQAIIETVLVSEPAKDSRPPWWHNAASQPHAKAWFAEHFKTMRLSIGFDSLLHLSEVVGTTTDHLERVESGTALPSTEAYRQLRRVFGPTFETALSKYLRAQSAVELAANN